MVTTTPKSGRFLLTMLGLALLSGCGADDDPAQEGDEESGTEASADDAVCTPGYEGCACAMDTCLAGLQCLSGLCVDAGPLEGTSEDTAPAEESTEEGESSTSAPLTAGEESTTSGGEESTTSESSTEESSTTEPEPECLEGDNYCAEATFQTCVEGQWQVQTCQENCAPLGYDSPGCASTDACTCEGFTDPVCESGAYNLCICADIDFAIPCTDEQLHEFYDQCIQMANEYVECFADYPIDEVADCAPAENACL